MKKLGNLLYLFFQLSCNPFRPSLLHSRFKYRHATLLTTSGEERCVTTLKTAVLQTIFLLAIQLFSDLLAAELMALFSNRIINRRPQLNLEWR